VGTLGRPKGGAVMATCPTGCDKIYSGEAFLTLTPKWGWICRVCHATGTDTFGQYGKPPAVDFEAYWEAYRAVDAAHAVMMLEFGRARGLVK